MEENQGTSSKSNKKKKRKISGSGKKSDSSATVELNRQEKIQPQTDKRPSSQQKQPNTQKQRVAEKQPVAGKQPQSQKNASQQQQPKAPKQPHSQQQCDDSEQQQPKPQKQPLAEKRPQSQKNASEQQPKSPKQPQQQKELASHQQQPKQQKQPKSPKPSESGIRPLPVKELLRKTEPQSDKQPKAKKQLKAQKQPLVEKQPHPEKQQPAKQSQPEKQPSPPKQTLKKKPLAEKQPSPEKQLQNQSPSVSESEVSESCTRQQSSKSASETEKLAAETTSPGKNIQNQKPNKVQETRALDSKCVPSGDSPNCVVTSVAPSAKENDCTDATCARNASAIIASAASIVQDTKMTGTTDVKTEGRPAVNKTREEIEAERKLRKAAKQAKKGKKPDEEEKVVKQLVEGVKQSTIDDKVEVPKESKEKSVQPKVEGEKNEKQAEGGGKSKAELRAERRAIQEAQRAAKAASKDTKQQQDKQHQQQPAKLLADKPAAAVPERLSTKPKTSPEPKSTERRVKLFSHLYQCSFKSISQSLKANHPLYHPAIVRLGVQYAERVVLGSNARCVALLHALKQVVADYETPPQKEFARGLEAYLQPNVEFLQQCRPLAVSMTNALRNVKRQLTALPNNIKDSEARETLQDSIDTYIKEQIETAAKAIGYTAKEKIADGDVILVYACSSLVVHALKITHEEGKKFSVVVVDSLPWLEGREMLRRLVSLGMKCTYVHISAASFVMREVTKVLLGAHALLTNGYVMSRAGSSQIALLAHSYNVPVLVFCETHKFSERVQTDSFVYNELANPDELVGKRRNGEDSENRALPLESWRDLPYLTLLNLVYDVTPPDLVTAVVTELAILPCTSVPVILRIKPTDC